MAAPKEAIPWPPQTTQDVLNLTPRKRRQQAFGTEPTSPSPLRRSTQPARLDGNESDSTAHDVSEDEETLQLELARIEAKLRLKKLQKRARKAASTASMNGSFGSSFTSTTSTQLPESPQKKPSAAVLVPASPSSRSSAAKQTVPASPKSPSRVLLGIDKGLTGRDISLRPPPQYRSGNRHSAVTTARAAALPPSPIRPGKSFSQRIAEERNRERAKAERAKVISQSRSKGFGLDVPTSGVFAPALSAAAVAAQRATQTFTNVLAQHDNKSPTTIGGSLSGVADPFTDLKIDTDTHDEAGFDSFSGLHLSKRTTPHPTVSRHLSQKQILLIPHLLKTVVSPAYEPPDVEGDWITLGIIASKSDPRTVGQNTGKANTNNAKYMVMQLTDLKWEIELFLFGAGFQRYWQLPVGTVIALLNPGVMKPRNTDTGRFSLTLADDAADAVLEIGYARDLAFCKSIKRDGKSCGTWIDRRHTSVCAFHVEQAVSKTRVSRPEINSVSRLFSPPKKGATRQQSRKFLSRGSAKEKDDGLLQEGPIADLPMRLGGAGGNVYVAPARTTSQLIDNDSEPHLRGTKEDRFRKRLVEAKKERELTKRLIATQGKEGGLGAQYLKARAGFITDEEKAKAAAEERRNNAAGTAKAAEILSTFGTSSGARDVRLSPIKRKRTETFSFSSATSSTSSSHPQRSQHQRHHSSASQYQNPYHPQHQHHNHHPLPSNQNPPLLSAMSKRSMGVGWGAGVKAAVARPTSSRGSSFHADEPVQKKTRFALVIPGNDSDDDGLDIVM